MPEQQVLEPETAELPSSIETTEQPMPVETPLEFQDEASSVEQCVKRVGEVLFNQDSQQKTPTPRDHLTDSLIRQLVYTEVNLHRSSDDFENPHIRHRQVELAAKKLSQAAEMIAGNRRGEDVALDEERWEAGRDLYFAEILLGQFSPEKAPIVMRDVRIDLDSEFPQTRLNEINIALAARAVDQTREEEGRPGKHYYDENQDKTLTWLVGQLEHKGYVMEKGLLVSPHASLEEIRQYQASFDPYRRHFSEKDALHRDRLNQADEREILALEEARDNLKRAGVAIENSDKTQQALAEAEASHQAAKEAYEQAEKELAELEESKKHQGFMGQILDQIRGAVGGDNDRKIKEQKIKTSQQEKKYRDTQRLYHAAAANNRMLSEARHTHQRITEEHGGHEALKNKIEGLKNRPRH
ncbi:MAG TPA: hypothetical protein VMQ44_03960 [Candidatus Saccharimonadales bacterium]|nr:hypothetical protein [Candidatus Saccharimonadales bacterium]